VHYPICRGLPACLVLSKTLCVHALLHINGSWVWGETSAPREGGTACGPDRSSHHFLFCCIVDQQRSDTCVSHHFSPSMADCFEVVLSQAILRMTSTARHKMKLIFAQVVRSVVMCFADLPRVTYERSDHSIKAAGIGARSAAAGGSAIQKVFLCPLLVVAECCWLY